MKSIFISIFYIDLENLLSSGIHPDMLARFFNINYIEFPPSSSFYI
jgi:hypothetical protein